MELLAVRLRKALHEIRQSGVIAKRNVNGCCRSCIVAEMEYGSTPIVWSFAGQGNRVSVVGDKASATSFYLYHDNLFGSDGNLNFAGRIVLFWLNTYGIVWEWDKTERQGILIRLDLSVSVEPELA